MAMINSIILEGNLREKSLKETASGVSVINFTLENERFYRKDGERQIERNEFQCVAYSELAKNIDNAEEGQGVRVVGRLHKVVWTNSDGKKCSKVEVVCEHAELKPIPVY